MNGVCLPNYKEAYERSREKLLIKIAMEIQKAIDDGCFGTSIKLCFVDKTLIYEIFKGTEYNVTWNNETLVIEWNHLKKPKGCKDHPF